MNYTRFNPILVQFKPPGLEHDDRQPLNVSILS